MTERKATPNEIDLAQWLIRSNKFWQKAWTATHGAMRIFKQLPEIYADFAAALGKTSLTDAEKRQAIINHVLDTHDD